MAFTKELIDGVDKDRIEEVLEGHVASLMSAFHWHSAPQEPGYWADRCYSREPISEDDKQFLRDLSNAVQCGE